MSEASIVRHCAPTLAGLKTANLFSCPCEPEEDCAAKLHSLDRQLAPKGIRVLPLRKSGDRILTYVYRPDRLAQDLCGCESCDLLRGLGYPDGCPDLCLARLIRRLREQEDFPHEIGLFLGYPPEDVRGFIENRAGEYKCAGLWKVYGDAEAARRTFDTYRQCTRNYCSRWEAGCSLDELVVAG